MSLRAIAILSLLAFSSWSVQGEELEANSLYSLEKMFEQIEAKTTWNVNRPLLWGYYFADHHPEKFRKLKTYLEQEGYRYVEVLEPEAGDQDQRYFLHVERIEHHSPKSLYLRNQQLAKLAQRFGVESYDGMDVGAAGK